MLHYRKLMCDGNVFRIASIRLRAFVIYTEAFGFSVTLQYYTVELSSFSLRSTVFSLLSFTVRYGGSTRRSSVRSKARNGTREGTRCASAGIPS